MTAEEAETPTPTPPPAPAPWPGLVSFAVAGLCLALAGLSTVMTFATNDYRYPLTGPFFLAVWAVVVGVAGVIRRPRRVDRILFGGLALGGVLVALNCVAGGVVIVWPF